MKTLLVMGLLTLSTSAFSSVVKSYDAKKGCTLYRVIHSDTKEKIKSSEKTYLDKEVYGFTFENMEVDFDGREVKVDPMINVVLGLNQSLRTSKSAIAEDNPNFSFLVNQLNRKLILLEKVCISDDNKIVYARQFEK